MFGLYVSPETDNLRRTPIGTLRIAGTTSRSIPAPLFSEISRILFSVLRRRMFVSSLFNETEAVFLYTTDKKKFVRKSHREDESAWDRRDDHLLLLAPSK